MDHFWNKRPRRREFKLIAFTERGEEHLNTEAEMGSFFERLIYDTAREALKKEYVYERDSREWIDLGGEA